MERKKKNLDWANLGFGYMKTNGNIRYYFKDGKWSEGQISEDENVSIHIAATALHYGQECFEGLKVKEAKDGRVLCFRVDENAKRMIKSAKKIYMEPPPQELFIESIFKVVDHNWEFIPPYGYGASLYVRPILLGLSPRIGVTPSTEYLYMVMVTPVGPYFKTGFKPIKLLVVEDVDRAAPLGVGDAKVGGNYAAGLRGTFIAKNKGYTECLYLDAKEKKYIDESGPANFFAITKDGTYVTPRSTSILPSITNMSLRQIAADLGWKVEERPIHIDELETFEEVGCCGTAAVITAVESIDYRGKRFVFIKDGKPGPKCTQLYEILSGIQTGDREDPYGWIKEIPITK